MIDRTIDQAQRERTARRCGEGGILVPTFAQMKDPNLISEGVKRELEEIGKKRVPWIHNLWYNT